MSGAERRNAHRSGLVVTRLPAAREGPGSNRAADKKLVFSRKSLRCAALGTGYTLTAVPRGCGLGRLSLPPSEGR